MKKTRQAILVALTTSYTLTTFAAEPAPIIVTATRTAQTADESLASVTVITKEQIEQQQPNDLKDLLTSVSGIDIANDGGLGKTTNLYMRGSSSSHVLILIDGVKVGSATTGSVAFQHIPVSQIERIEIVRGPRAALYGSEAVGGVIQIFTKKGSGQEQGNIELGYGTFSTNKLSAGLSTQVSNTSISINASHFKTAGFDALDDSETDNDGYTNNSAILNIAHKIGATSALNINLMRASGRTEYDGFYNGSDFVQQMAGVNYNFSALSNWNVKLGVSESKDANENFSGLSFQSRYITTRENYTWQNDINIGPKQILTIGLDYQNDAVNSTTSYDKTSRNNSAGYIQHQWAGENNDLQIGLRNDENQAFGTHVTGNLAWGHNFSKDFRVISSLGTAFKAPTFNDLYWPVDGDPNLKPEESTSAEIELRSKHKWGKVSLSAYSTQIDNLISGWPPANVNKAVIKGMELRLNTKIAGWDTRADLSLLNPRDKVSGKLLQRRAKEMLRIDMDKSSGKWSSGLSFIGQSYRYEDVANTKKINGYGIINLRASYALSKKLSVKWKIENLLDKEYETNLNYNTPGISGYVSLVYQGF